MRPITQERNTYSPRQRVGTLGATMGSRVQVMDGQISIRQRTEQPDTMMRSWADAKRPSRRGNQPQKQLLQRWRRGRHHERTTSSREWERLPHTREKTHLRVRRGRSPCMESSSHRPGQARRHKKPGSTLLGESRMPLLCPHPRRCGLMLKISERIRGAPQRRRGVRSQGRLRGGGERGGRG